MDRAPNSNLTRSGSAVWPRTPPLDCSSKQTHHPDPSARHHHRMSAPAQSDVTPNPDAPWYAAFPTPTSAPPRLDPDYLHGLITEHGPSSNEFLVIDVRRTDFEVSSCIRSGSSWAQPDQALPFPPAACPPTPHPAATTSARLHPRGRQPPCPLVLPNPRLGPPPPSHLQARHLPLPELVRPGPPLRGLAPGRARRATCHRLGPQAGRGRPRRRDQGVVEALRHAGGIDSQDCRRGVERLNTAKRCKRNSSFVVVLRVGGSTRTQSRGERDWRGENHIRGGPSPLPRERDEVKYEASISQIGEPAPPHSSCSRIKHVPSLSAPTRPPTSPSDPSTPLPWSSLSHPAHP